MKIHKATIADIDSLINLRVAFLKDELISFTQEEEENVRNKGLIYFEKHINADELIALFAKVDNEIVATVFLLITEKPISPLYPNGYTGTLLNVFTYPQYRRLGYAKSLIEEVIRLAKERNVSLIDLIATPDGIELYKKLGFKEPQYTALRLNLEK